MNSTLVSDINYNSDRQIAAQLLFIFAVER